MSPHALNLNPVFKTNKFNRLSLISPPRFVSPFLSFTQNVLAPALVLLSHTLPRTHPPHSQCELRSRTHTQTHTHTHTNTHNDSLWGCDVMHVLAFMCLLSCALILCCALWNRLVALRSCILASGVFLCLHFSVSMCLCLSLSLSA